MKCVVELWLDGYETEEEMEEACHEFIYRQLNFTASSVKIIPIEEYEKEIREDEKRRIWSGYI